MPLDDVSSRYANIVPRNNLRLPDALTIKHGPARLLARFVLAGDRAARRAGIQLRLRHDFEELAYLSKQPIAQRSKFRLMNMFNRDYAEDLSPENSYWISGEDEYGEIVLTQAGRVFDWPETTLADEARLMFFGGRDVGQQCLVTAEAAKYITGVAFYGGQGWVRPDFRGRHLSRLFPRLGRAYALARWPIDWTFSYVAPLLVEKGIAHGYGYRHLSPSILYPDTQWGPIEAVVACLSAEEAYDDFAEFLITDLSDPKPVDALSRSIDFDDSVTRTSSLPVFQGSSSLS